MGIEPCEMRVQSNFWHNQRQRPKDLNGESTYKLRDLPTVEKATALWRLCLCRCQPILYFKTITITQQFYIGKISWEQFGMITVDRYQHIRGERF